MEQRITPPGGYNPPGLDTYTFTVTRASTLPVTVRYVTVDGSALGGDDYEARSGKFTFSPGQTSKAITVAVLGDTLKEANETFQVYLYLPTGATLFDPFGQGMITDDD